MITLDLLSRLSAHRGALIVALSTLLACVPAEQDGQQASAELTGSAAGWNVVVLSVDTLRADRLGSYGYETRATSPSTDALLARGVRFERAHSPRSLTWPALASALTGLYPSGHGVVLNGYELPGDLDTLPLVLGRRGYRTGAFLSNMCKANHQGWDAFFCAGGVDARATRRALAWLEAGAAGAEPVLLWVHLFGPHPPYYNGGDRARAELDPGYEGFLAPKKRVLDSVMTGPVPLSTVDVRHLDALYDAAVAGTDRYVAQLIDGIGRSLDLRRTMIVFLADHGEDLYQHHGYLYHACSVYESSLHVPLAFVLPGIIPEGTTVADNVELVDVFPTVLELLGIEPTGCVHGRTLTPLLRRRNIAQVEPESSALGEYGDSEIGTWVSGRWKLVLNPGGEVPVCMKDAPPGHYPIGAVELYDLLEDAAELDDLASREPSLVARLAAERSARATELCTPSATTPDEPEISDELRQQLEQLGYVVEEDGR